MVVQSVLALFAVALNGPTPARATEKVLIKNNCIATPAGAGASRPIAEGVMGVVGVVVMAVEGKVQVPITTTKIHREVASPASVRMETAFKTASLLRRPLSTKPTHSTGCRT